jgi:hypothetical protein
VIRKQTKECIRDGVTYRWETTWDDETGNSEILEFDANGELNRRCDWRIWPDSQQTPEQSGEAVWYDATGSEIERRPISHE